MGDGFVEVIATSGDAHLGEIHFHDTCHVTHRFITDTLTYALMLTAPLKYFIPNFLNIFSTVNSLNHPFCIVLLSFIS